MNELISFAVGQIFKPKFWGFVGASFAGVVLLTFRNNYRNEIFKSATDWVKSGKKSIW